MWKQCSYIIHKSTSCVRIDPFLRYMWFEGRPSESSWLGWAVDFREGSRDQKSFFFFHRLFLFFCLPSCPPLCTTFTSVSPLCSTCPPCTPVFNCVCPISPPTLLHLPCACSALSSPLNLISTHRSHAFWLPSRHWNSCSKGSGPVFRAGFLAAGPPQFPLHAFTTTCLTLLPSLFCVQGSASNSSNPPFWVAAGKLQKKVWKQVIDPSLHFPPLALIHPHCSPPLTLAFARSRPSFFLVCTKNLPFRHRFFLGKKGLSCLSLWCLALCFCWQVAL